MKYIKESTHEFDKAFGDRLKHMAKYSATNDFWDFVELCEWDECVNRQMIRNDRKYEIETIMKKVAPKYSFKKFMQFKVEYDKLYHFAFDKFYNVEDLGVSDDGYTDLMSSVVGFGRDHFMKLIMDESFEEITKMAQNRNYCENFGYIFHVLYDIESDYKPSRKKAEKIREEWDKIYNENNPK